MSTGVSRLNLTGLLMQPRRAGVGLGLVAMTLSDLGIRCSVGLGLRLALVLQRASRPLSRALFTCESGIAEAAVAHPRNIALAGT
jgi:hypothetical protein